MALTVGSTVAGYRIEEVLGSGGMGTVYRAAHPTRPRSDALKVLSAEYSRDEQFRARFIREADLAAALDHPNIVTVYNRGETDEGQLWISMQYVPGSDADREQRAGRMSPQRAVHIVTEVAKALDYAHARNLVHRDVKPGNFLLAREGDRVLLADFGIARALDDATGLTATGVVMASVAYAAPEVLAGEHVDGRADIYSLGCALYRMLTGRTPFTNAGGWAGMAYAHMSKPVPRVTEFAPALPPAIDPVIARAMAKDPDRRFQTAGEFVHAVNAALRAETTAPTARTPPVVPRPEMRSPVPPPDAVTYPSGHFSGPRRPPAPPPPPSKRGRWVVAALVAVTVLAAAAITSVIVFAPGERTYQAQTLSHVHGTTELTARPTAVAALGPGDTDAVLSVGVQPVVAIEPGGEVPEWEKSRVTGSTKVLGFLDTAAVAAADPDVIIATGDIDDATYDKLAAIAPTITRPEENSASVWTWQTQLKWIGRILGEDEKAQDLLNTARSQQDDLRNEHSAFSGKTVEALKVSDTGVSVVLRQSRTTDYLDGLGFRYSDALGRRPGDAGPERPIPDLSELYQIKTDVLVVIRTDSLAGSGGFNGLPRQLTVYKGTIVIVDNPGVIGALADPGGYLATEYLNSNLVPTIAARVR